MYVDIIFLLQFLNAVIESNLQMKISKKLGMCVTSTSYLAVVKIRCASNCNQIISWLQLEAHLIFTTAKQFVDITHIPSLFEIFICRLDSITAFRNCNRKNEIIICMLIYFMGFGVLSIFTEQKA